MLPTKKTKHNSVWRDSRIEEQIRCPETSVTIYKPTPRNIPEEIKPHLHSSRRLQCLKTSFAKSPYIYRSTSTL